MPIDFQKPSKISTLGLLSATARFSLTGFLFCLLVSQTGCQIFQRFRPQRESAPVVFDRAPSQQELIAHLNNQAHKVNQLKTNVRVSLAGMPTLRGTLTVERPKRLRLKAGLLGVSELGVDVGSNDQYFWIWTKAALPGETPTIYYASHEGYKNSPIRQSLPMDPGWIIDALGFVNFDSADRHDGPFLRRDGRYEIRSYIQSTSGPTARISVIDPKHGWISQQSIYDSNGRLAAYVDSIKHKSYPSAGISLPQRIEIHVFQPNGQEMKLVVDADDYTINSLHGDPDKMWAMPQPQDIPIVDLAKIRPVNGKQGPVSPGAQRNIGYRSPSNPGQ